MCAFQTIVGRISPQLHATPHLLVLSPCTNSLAAQFVTPLSFNFSMMVPTLLNFPNILVYHCTLSCSDILSSIMRLIKATSPPGVTISISAPVQAECGGRDLDAAEVRSSVVEEKKGGLQIVKSML